MSLPGVSELLRTTAPRPAPGSPRDVSGRETHSQKITVYLSAQELLELERARLTLRARGISVDRGRLVREAIAVLLADLDAGLDASEVVRRLRERGGGPAGRPPAGGAGAGGTEAGGTEAGGTEAGGAGAGGAGAGGTEAGGTPADGGAGEGGAGAQAGAS